MKINLLTKSSSSLAAVVFGILWVIHVPAAATPAHTVTYSTTSESITVTENAPYQLNYATRSDNTQITTAPTHGSAVVNAYNVIYTPNTNYLGSDSMVVVTQTDSTLMVGGVILATTTNYNTDTVSINVVTAVPLGAKFILALIFSIILATWAMRRKLVAR